MSSITAVPESSAVEGIGNPDAAPSGPQQSREAAGTSSPFRILHISDVHFGAHFDPSLWAYVTALVARERPNLIVCTGDIVDHGSLFMLAVARVTLEKLAAAAGTDCVLRVVPGNHDRGLFGNFALGPRVRHFEALFGASPISVDNVPTYDVHASRGFLWRWMCRGWTSGKLAVPRLWWGFTAGEAKRLPLLRDDDPAEVSLIYLDSNYGMRLATGSVDVKQLMHLQAGILSRRDEQPERAFVPRIALMHHHPLPIPHASIKEGLTSFEPFLVLRNAGSVLRELNRCDVDLVLHGHKHYSSFGKLGYATDDHNEGEIAVLAAGSTGVTHSESGRNSVNFIDIFPNGQMAYTTIAYGGGRGQAVTELFRNNRPIHTLEMHKRRAFRRGLEHHGQHAYMLRKQLHIGEWGLARVQEGVERLRIDRGLAASVRPIRLGVSLGGMNPASVRLDDQSKSCGYVITGLQTSPSQRLHFGIDLRQPLTSATPALSYGYTYAEFNTYILSEWEAAQAAEYDRRNGKLGRAAGLDFVSLVVRIPAKRLSLSAKIETLTAGDEPGVRVMRWSGYPKVSLDDAREFVEQDGEWVLDANLSAHEMGRLRKKGEDVWTLDVEYPLVGHRYDITWRVRDKREVADINAMRTAVAIRKRLLFDSRQRGMHSERNACERLGELLGPFSNFLHDCFKSHIDVRELFAVAMFIYDEEHQCLREINEIRLGGGATLTERKDDLCLPLGEGVAGAALKRGVTVTYTAPELSDDSHEGSYLYESKPDGRRQKWQVMHALPLYSLPSGPGPVVFGWEGRSAQEAVGVLTIASTAPDSGLLQIPLKRNESDVLNEKADDENENAGESSASGTSDHGASSNSTEKLRKPSLDKVWMFAHWIISQSCSARPKS